MLSAYVSIYVFYLKNKGSMGSKSGVFSGKDPLSKKKYNMEQNAHTWMFFMDPLMPI